MNPILIKFALILCSLSCFLSCKGPKQTEQEDTVTTTSSIGKAVTELDKSIWVIYQDTKNNYWFGSNQDGAYWYDGKTLKQFTTIDGLASDQIRGIQEDKRGTIFFDTPDGVSKFDGEKFVTLLSVESTYNQWKLNPDDLWFKGNWKIPGVYRYDGDTLYHLEFSGFGSKISGDEYSTYSIYKDKQGHIWFGTLSAGVCRFDGTPLSWLRENELGELEDGRVPGVRTIIEDKDGLFWLSNILSRYRINPNNPIIPGKIQYEKLTGIDVSEQQISMQLPYFNSAVVDEKNGDIWMTNYNEGVWKYSEKKLTHYPIKDGETDILIVSIFKDKQGVLWLGTDNDGVYKWNGKKFERLGL